MMLIQQQHRDIRGSGLTDLAVDVAHGYRTSHHAFKGVRVF